tara:strand:+ start:110 stop:604 length:495 start_codon:yes stop_codon:yes gene_type:complete
MMMKKIIYIEEEFLSKEECKNFIEYYLAHKSSIEYYSNYQSSTFILNIFPTYKKNKIFSETVDRVSQRCKSFDSNISLQDLQIVKWPRASFMKPHLDHIPDDIFAAMIYLNDDFTGGYTCFEHLKVKPEVGKMIIFSNTQYRHYVSEVNSGMRYTFAFWFIRSK